VQQNQQRRRIEKTTSPHPQDNTAKLEAEVAERARAEQRFRSLVDTAIDAIIIVDMESGKFTEEVNPSAEAFFGFSREELLGNYGPHDLSPEFQPDGRPSKDAAMIYLQQALDGEVPSFEWIHRTADGTVVPCHITLSRFPDPNRRLVRASLVDLTERKREEAARLELERQLVQVQKLESIGQLTGALC